MDGPDGHCCFLYHPPKKFKMHPPRKYKKLRTKKDNVFTLIRKLNTVAGSPKKWTRKRRCFYADSETQHGRQTNGSSSRHFWGCWPQKSRRRTGRIPGNE